MAKVTSQRTPRRYLSRVLDRLQRIRQMLAESPDDAFLRFAEAQELRKAGNLEDAAQKFEALRALVPAYVGLYYHLAAVYVELDNAAKAEEIYTTGIDVAQSEGDQHALAELRNAHMNWQLDMD